MKTKLFCLFFIFSASVEIICAQKVQIGDLYYNLDATNQTAEVAGINLAIDSIDIPASVTYDSVTYSVTSIGYMAFWGYFSLSSISLPNSILSIGEEAFMRCKGLQSIEIPINLTKIGSRAFHDCTGLKTVVWNAKKCADFKSAPFECLDNGSTYIHITSFVFGNEVEHIPAYLCAHLIKLTTINIPSSVTSIGNSAFEHCENVTSFDIPNTITKLGTGVFRGCINATSINILQNLTTIPDETFYACSKLESIIIPSNIVSIGKSAFYACSSLVSIELPNSVTNIGVAAFNGCSGLLDFKIPTGINTVSTSMLCNCRGLKTIEIPNNIVSISAGAFQYCDNLEKVTIGENVKEIGYYAFGYCNKLDSIYCIRNRPANADERAFYNVNVEKCKLYVPSGSENMYMVAIAWRDFDNIFGFVPSTAIDNTFVKNASKKKVFHNGQIVIQNGEKTFTITGAEIKQ